MNIHEFQAKQLLKQFGAPVSNGVVIYSPNEIQLFNKILNKLIEQDNEMTFRDVEDCIDNNLKMKSPEWNSALMKFEKAKWLSRDGPRGYWEIGIRSHLELQPIIEAQLLAKLTSSNDDGDGYSQADALEAARLELPQIIVY